MEVGGVPSADVRRGHDRRTGLHREERLLETGGDQPGDLAVATHCSPLADNERSNSNGTADSTECQWQRRQQKLFARAPYPPRVYVRTEASGREAILPGIIRMPWKRLRGRGMCRSENHGLPAACRPIRHRAEARGRDGTPPFIEPDTLTHERNVSDRMILEEWTRIATAHHD